MAYLQNSCPQNLPVYNFCIISNPEVAIQMCSIKKLFLVFLENHRKTPEMEFCFSNVVGLYLQNICKQLLLKICKMTLTLNHFWQGNQICFGMASKILGAAALQANLYNFFFIFMILVNLRRMLSNMMIDRLNFPLYSLLLFKKLWILLQSDSYL